MTVLLKVFTLLGGLAFFLYGMNVMSGGLGKLAGGSLERSLKTMTKNRFAGMALGAVITIAIQSSSAMTVMLVGLSTRYHAARADDRRHHGLKHRARRSRRGSCRCPA